MKPYLFFRELRNQGVYIIASLFLLYPLLHELGHALAAGLFGGKVVRITVFPAFYTECFIRPEQIGCYLVTAMAGILFPLLCSLAVNIHRERGFLIAFCLRVMSVGHSVGEIFCVCRCILGSTRETSDLSILIYETNVDPYVSLVLAGFLFVLSLILLAWLGPLELFGQLFAIGKQRS